MITTQKAQQVFEAVKGKGAPDSWSSYADCSDALQCLNESVADDIVSGKLGMTSDFDVNDCLVITLTETDTGNAIGSLSSFLE
jgi:hypothetical protein